MDPTKPTTTSRTSTSTPTTYPTSTSTPLVVPPHLPNFSPFVSSPSITSQTAFASTPTSMPNTDTTTTTTTTTTTAPSSVLPTKVLRPLNSEAVETFPNNKAESRDVNTVTSSDTTPTITSTKATSTPAPTSQSTKQHMDGVHHLSAIDSDNHNNNNDSDDDDSNSDWTCENCTLKNSASETCCEECGVPKPTAAPTIKQEQTTGERSAYVNNAGSSGLILVPPKYRHKRLGTTSPLDSSPSASTPTSPTALARPSPYGLRDRQYTDEVGVVAGGTKSRSADKSKRGGSSRNYPRPSRHHKENHDDFDDFDEYNDDDDIDNNNEDEDDEDDFEVDDPDQFEMFQDDEDDHDNESMTVGAGTSHASTNTSSAKRSRRHSTASGTQTVTAAERDSTYLPSSSPLGESSVDPFSWPDRVERVLRDHGGKGTGREVREWVLQQFPEVRRRNNWESSIRSCLSNNRRFVKAGYDGNFAVWKLRSPTSSSSSGSSSVTGTSGGAETPLAATDIDSAAVPGGETTDNNLFSLEDERSSSPSSPSSEMSSPMPTSAHSSARQPPKRSKVKRLPATGSLLTALQGFRTTRTPHVPGLVIEDDSNESDTDGLQISESEEEENENENENEKAKERVDKVNENSFEQKDKYTQEADGEDFEKDESDEEEEEEEDQDEESDYEDRSSARGTQRSTKLRGASHQPTVTTRSSARIDARQALGSGRGSGGGAQQRTSKNHDYNDADEDASPATTTTASTSKKRKRSVSRQKDATTWSEKIDQVLREHGGRGTCENICKWVAHAFPRSLEGKENWRRTISACLSVDDSFVKGQERVGKGVIWSLRGWEDTTTSSTVPPTSPTTNTTTQTSRKQQPKRTGRNTATPTARSTKKAGVANSKSSTSAAQTHRHPGGDKLGSSSSDSDEPESETRGAITPSSKRRRTETSGGQQHQSTSFVDGGASSTTSSSPMSSSSSSLQATRATTWPDKITIAMSHFNGEATAAEICEYIEENFADDVAKRPNWKNVVRASLSNSVRFLNLNKKRGDATVWFLTDKLKERVSQNAPATAGSTSIVDQHELERLIRKRKNKRRESKQRISSSRGAVASLDVDKTQHQHHQKPQQQQPQQRQQSHHKVSDGTANKPFYSEADDDDNDDEEEDIKNMMYVDDNDDDEDEDEEGVTGEQDSDADSSTPPNLSLLRPKTSPSTTTPTTTVTSTPLHASPVSLAQVKRPAVTPYPFPSSAIYSHSATTATTPSHLHSPHHYPTQRISHHQHYLQHPQHHHERHQPLEDVFDGPTVPDHLDTSYHYRTEEQRPVPDEKKKAKPGSGGRGKWDRKTKARWPQMIEAALERNGGQGSIQQLYRWLEEMYPRETAEKDGWRKLVSAHLSTCRRFARQPREGQQGGLWYIVSASDQPQQQHAQQHQQQHLQPTWKPTVARYDAEEMEPAHHHRPYSSPIQQQHRQHLQQQHQQYPQQHQQPYLYHSHPPYQPQPFHVQHTPTAAFAPTPIPKATSTPTSASASTSISPAMSTAATATAAADDESSPIVPFVQASG
eukprot:TRINITY_DN1453_c0_g1_i3.p1 TRINITY_DN1453_c0_g1~~TRINITY_DN1453_c0_g1_i3.p1  ORF type:complete len:1537 (+),score=443.53 TRINITY_DN1453_c0_g1_i3:1017-5627(+)